MHADAHIYHDRSFYQERCMIFLFSTAFSLIVATSGPAAITKEQILDGLKKTSPAKSPSWEAKLRTAASVQGISVEDSGTVVFSPPSCYRILLHGSKSEHAGCGDTSWLKASDGRITVTPNTTAADHLSANGLTGRQWDVFVEQLFSSAKCAITSRDSLAVISAELRESAGTTHYEITVHTGKWLVTKVVMNSPATGLTTTTYEHVLFEKNYVVGSITTEMRQAGLVTHRFSDFRKIRRKPLKYFRLLR
jgi:hypothetical protein